ncbi:MAG: PAS domain S-box protein [Dehalococcoidia bacterium]
MDMKRKLTGAKSIITMLNAIPDPAFLVNSDGVVLDVNSSFERVVGLKRKQVVGKDFLDADFLPQDAVGFLRKRFTRLKKGLAVRSFIPRELYLPDQNGNGIYLEMTAKSMEYQGEIVDVIVLRDITERKRLEEILRCGEETVPSVIEETSDVIFMLDASGKIEYCSPSAETLLGYDPDELKEKRVADLVHPEDAAVFEEITQKQQLMDYGTRVEARLQQADGSWRYFELAGKNVLNDPSIQGLVLRFRDITEYKQTEFDLEGSESRFKAIFENASDGIIYFNPSGEILDVNPRMEQIFGFSRDQLIGTNFADLAIASPEETARIIELFYEALKGDYSQLVELKLYRKDRSSVNVAVSVGIVKSGEQTEALFVIVRDIQKRKEDEARIEHLNNVLRAIRNVNQLIVRERDRDRMIKKACETLIESRDYTSAWIAVMDEEGEVVSTEQAGIEEGFLSLASQLKKGEWPYCAKQVLATRGIVCIDAPSSECGRCPLRLNFKEGGVMAARLESNERVFGVISVYGSDLTEVSEDERYLFEEVAEDIAFALYSIELEEERVVAEKALIEREQEYSSLVELSPDGILVLKGPEIVFMNEKASEIVGYPVSECVGKSIYDLIKLNPPDNFSESQLEDLLSDMEKNLSESGRARTFTMPVKSSGGDLIWLEVKSSPIEYRGEPARLEFIRDITERIRNEEAVRESEEKLRVLFDTIDDGITITDLEGRVIDANRTGMLRHGYTSKEDLIGTYGLDFIAEGDRERAIEDMGKALSDNDPKNLVEYTLLTNDGNEIQVEATASLLYDKSGNPYAFVNVTRDITERKQMERGLKESEEKYRELVENMAEVVYLISADGSVSYVTPSVETLLGYSPAEIAEKHFSDFVYGEDLARMEINFAKLLSGHAVSAEYRFVARSGKQIWLRTSSQPVFEGDQVVGARGVLIDITERKQVEDALRESEERIRAIMDNSFEGVTIVSREGNIIFESPANDRLLGYQPGAGVGKDIFRFVHPDEQQRLIEDFTRLINSPGDVFSSNYRVQHIDGSWHIINVTGKNCIDDPHIDGMVVNFRDITEQIGAEEALRESEEKFREIFDNANDEMLYLDKYGNVLDINRRVEDIFGYKPEEVIGRSFAEMEFVSGEEMERFTEEMFKAIESGEPRHLLELEARHRDGHKIWVEASPSLISRNGDVEGLLIIVRDITERKEAEEMFARLAMSSQIGTYIVQDGGFVFVNPAFQKDLDLSEEELLVTDPLSIVHPDDREKVRQEATRMLKGESETGYEFRSIDKHGNQKYAFEKVTSIEYGGRRATLGSYMDITALKEAEVALRQAEGKYRNLVEQINEVIFSATEDGNITYISPSVEALSGYKPDELIGHNFAEIIHEGDFPFVLEMFERALRGDAVYSLECRVILKSGDTKWIRASEQPIMEGERVAGFRGVVTDIDERKKAEEALKQSEEKYRNLVEQISDIIFFIDREGVFTYISPVVESVTGYSEPEVIGRRFTDFIYKEDFPKVLEQFDKTRFTGELQQENEFRVVIKTGQIRWIRTTVRPVLEGEQIIGFTGVISDITERKQAERTILESEQKFREIFESAKDEIIYLDEDGTVVDRNIKGADILGFTREEVIGKKFFEIGPVMPQEKMEKFAKVFQETLEGRAVQGLAEFEMSHRDGRTVYVEANISLIERDGINRGMLIVFRDVTERKQMQEQLAGYWSELERRLEELQIAYERLKELDKMKDSFLSTVSHELRTPLTSIKSFAEILLTYEGDREVQEEFLKIINDESERLTRLINDFLDLSKIESGRIEWYSTIVETPDVIDKALAANDALLKGMDMNLEVEVEPDLPPVWCDRDRLIQVVTNLINNATKFTSSGGTIRVRAERYKPYGAGENSNMVKISITDNGLGIAPEDHEAIFDKFTQIGDTLTDKPQGSGLGLPICKEIIEHYDGEIWVKSAPGEGSTFSFTLPAAQENLDRDDERVESKAESEPENAGLNGGNTILVVDDEPNIRRFLSHELTSRGYRVIEASGGREAMDMVRTYLPDLVTLDIMMPDMNGLDVTTMLKENSLTRHIPIMVISIMDERTEAVKRGADEYLSKPCSGDVILEKVTGLLRKPSKMILVVDDDETLVESITYESKHRGYSTLVAHNGEQALEMAKNNPPDLIILDMLMPGMDGHEVIRRLKSSEETAGIPVIVLTGAEISGGRVKALELGASGYFNKSGGLKKLFETASAILTGQSVR